MLAGQEAQVDFGKRGYLIDPETGRKRTLWVLIVTLSFSRYPRQLAGGRSTDTSDYPVGKAAYAKRSVEHVVDKARSQGHHVGLYAERILAGPLPWARMRQAYSLLALCDKFGAGRVEAACQSAIAFGVIDVSRIKRMLSNALRPALPASPDRKVVPLPLPRFARDTKHFETRASKKEEA